MRNDITRKVNRYERNVFNSIQVLFTGGHNGLESIILQFGTEGIPRLRIGIGSAPSEGAVDHVLGRFFEEERPIVEKTIARAAEAVKCAIDKGVLSAMNLFNKFPES